MAVRNIAVTDTLETFRTEFNDLAANDFGDIANLSGSISSTNLVDAMNETISIATSTAGWTIEDSSSTQQIIGGGNILRVNGTSNEIEAVVSATDTLTIGLPDAVSITSSVTAPTVTGGSIQITGNTITATDSTAISFGSENLTTTGSLTANTITGSGSTHTLGTVEISGNTIRSTDSTELNINDGVQVQGTLKTNSIAARTGDLVNFGANNIQTDGFIYLSGTSSNLGISFEGATVNDFQIFLQSADPTADRTITLPDNTGTLITTGSTDAVSEAMMANDAIGQNELKSVVTLQILNSSGTVVKTLYGAGA
ncbi:hypothetical protein Mosig_00098 [Pelagibacter phage Mosig EXVC030M]|nr:hypothetical protein Mosig_00098 [Pelagibacter phage Mosig EXVC030M]